MSSEHPHDQLPLERLVFFSDAVFAIAITLLVIELRVPDIPRSAPEGDVAGLLLQVLPKLLGFVLSFLVIGAYWIGHNRIYRVIHRYDDNLLWRNLLFLMGIAFMPFPTALYSEYASRPTVVILYAGSLALVGLLQLWQWRYAARGFRLLDADTTPAYVRLMTLRTLTVPFVCVVVIALALINPRFAGMAFFLIPVINRIIERKRKTRTA